jgi:diguanylate cyclase (GGDEF)-like protein
VVEIDVRARLIDLNEVKYLNCILRDVSDLNRARRMERELEHKQTHDALTDLPGKALLLDAITQAIHTAERTGKTVTLAAMELSRLSTLSVSLGHEVSDHVQIELAQRLRELQPKSHMVARVRNQDFMYLVDGSEDPSAMSELLTRLLRVCNTPFHWQDTPLQLEPHIGVSTYPKDAQDAVSLLQSAEAALYKAKQEGRMGVVLASVELSEEVENLVKKESRLRAAMLNHEFEVFYQPRVNLASGKISGAEALIRWRDPELGLISPIDFVPLATEIGLIGQMTDEMLAKVCQQQKAWLDAGVTAVPVSVNLVADNFSNDKIVSVIQNLLTDNQLDARYLEVELTESAAMTHVEQTIAVLKRIREMGVLVAIDDFGTGYSSLSYLEKFPLDILKIDISFIREILSNPHAVVITSVIVAMAKEFGFLIVAEGVEQDKQREFLLKLHCDEGQGYLFSRPVAALAFEQLLKENRTY